MAEGERVAEELEGVARVVARVAAVRVGVGMVVAKVAAVRVVAVRGLAKAVRGEAAVTARGTQGAVAREAAERRDLAEAVTVLEVVVRAEEEEMVQAYLSLIHI